ncbi:hypothetical protein CDL15_Pgr005976 [Punica granatum]|uniref:Uncharacterized protein n=1 Tax=Punica granatum TaxID=22663 RepID=A0A218XKL7_PUNGR|nr:hypothetical protein CDL15_Pgr005976 [Punica granatum]
MAPNRSGWNAGQTRLAQVGSDIATEASDGSFEQGQRLPTDNSPPEVAVVVVFRKESWINPIYKKTAHTEAPDGILRQGRRPWVAKGPL